jgi:hypothetical protein
VLVTGAAGTAGVLLWGYISERYLADFLPFLIVAGGVGLIDVWRRFEGRSRKARGSVLAIISVVAAYCVVANFAIAVEPAPQMTSAQVRDFVSTEESLSVSSLANSVQHGTTLPNWGPYGQLFMVGNCSGLYVASGISEANVPGLLIDHFTWIPVEQSSTYTRLISFTFNRPGKYFTKPVTLMTYGASSVVLRPVGTDSFQIVVKHSGTSLPWPSTASGVKPIYSLHYPFQIRVTTDPNLHQINVTWYGTYLVTHYIAGTGPPVVHPTPKTDGPLPPVTVTEQPVSSSTSLCRSLQRGH